jgi:hypothetical protein
VAQVSEPILVGHADPDLHSAGRCRMHCHLT